MDSNTNPLKQDEGFFTTGNIIIITFLTLLILLIGNYIFYN